VADLPDPCAFCGWPARTTCACGSRVCHGCAGAVDTPSTFAPRHLHVHIEKLRGPRVKRSDLPRVNELEVALRGAEANIAGLREKVAAAEAVEADPLALHLGKTPKSLLTAMSDLAEEIRAELRQLGVDPSA
jgi:hypothetical protein